MVSVSQLPLALALRDLTGGLPGPEVGRDAKGDAALAVLAVAAVAGDVHLLAAAGRRDRAADVVHQIRAVRLAPHHRRVVGEGGGHLLREGVGAGRAAAALGAYDARHGRPVVQPAALYELRSEEVMQPSVLRVAHDSAAPGRGALRGEVVARVECCGLQVKL